MTSSNSNNPFVGLRPFESHESLLFFGRQSQTLELLQRLHDHHFVAVTGSSGSGKSSLIKAGLIPLLKAGFLVNDRDEWLIAQMKPGKSPLCNLAASLLSLRPDQEGELTATLLEQQIRESGIDAVMGVLKPLFKSNSNLFLLVDQFEELFRFAQNNSGPQSKDEAIDFVNVLLHMVKQGEFPVYIVLTMRSDFIGDCAQFYGLPEAMNESQFIVPRLNRVQLRNSIEGPVKLYGGKINPALTDRLLNDLQLVRDELPLLQHVLLRIWEQESLRDRNGELDLEDYQRTGGIEKALSNHADECLQGMLADEMELTKKVFQSMTAIDENARKIRRPVTLKELESLTGASEEQLLNIINRFIDGDRSFLIVSKIENKNDLLIDISHESLIRQWSKLNGWVDEEATAARAYLRLADSAERYGAGKKDLLTGIELQQMLQWYQTFHPAATWAERYRPGFQKYIDYLSASEKEWKAGLEREKRARDQKLRNLRILLALTLIVIVLIGVIAYGNYLRNIQTHNELARNYWNNSQSARSQKRFLESLHYTAEAINASRNEDLTRNLLLDIQPLIPQAALEHIFTHNGPVYDVAFSPDGHLILTGSYDSTARLWDRTTGRQSGSPLVHDGAVKSVAFSTDGKLIVTASDDGTARIWDVAGGKSPLKLQHRAAVNTAVFSPDGKWVLTAGNDSTARLWYSGSGQPSKIVMRHLGMVNSAVFDGAGKRIVTSGTDNCARLWDMMSGKQLGASMYHRDSVTLAVFSPDGTKILTAGMDGTARIWDAATGLSSGNPLKHEKPVYSAVFSADGKYIVTAGFDNVARVWNAATQEQTGGDLQHEGAVNSAVFSADGRYVLTASYDKTTRIWNALTGRSIGTPLRQEGIVYKAVFSPDNRQIVTVSRDMTAKLWTVSPAPAPTELIRQRSIMYSAQYSPDQKKIITAGADSTARLWDAATGKQIVQPLQHSGLVYSAVFSHDGTKILTAASDGSVQIWDAFSGAPVRSFSRQRTAVISAVYSHDDKFVLTAGGEDAQVFDSMGKVILPPLPHGGPVYSAVFSRDGTQILTASYDGTARLWDAVSGQESGPPFRQDNNLFCAAFSPDARQVVTAGMDGYARLWDVATRKQLGPALRHEKAIRSVFFSPDGGMILTAGTDSTARLWEAGSGKQIGMSFVHTSPLDRAVFSPDGNKFITAGYNGTVTVWDIAGDLDLPPDLCRLEAQTITGTRLDIETGEIIYLPAGEWYRLKDDYRKKAAAHLRHCAYPEMNFWKRLNE